MSLGADMSRIKVKNYRISMPRSKDRPHTPIRIALISDLHNRLFGEGNGELADVIHRLYPDLVLSAGDLTVSSKTGMNPDVGLSLLKRLACDCPVYCVNGNHECRAKERPEAYGDAYRQLTGGMRRAGITLLENESVPVDINGAKLMLHGLELPMKYYKKMDNAFITAEEIRKYIGVPDEERYNILLVHSPLYFESYALWGAQLSLCGHLHGGLIRLPFVGGLISPQVKLFPRYAYGLYEKYGRRMVVTSGLGSHSIAIRINNPPEVVLLELT